MLVEHMGGLDVRYKTARQKVTYTSPLTATEELATTRRVMNEGY